MSNQHRAPYALPTLRVRDCHPLAAEYSAASKAIEKATDQLLRVGVFKDFYPQGDAALQQALDERAEMFRKLADLQAYANAWERWASDQVEADKENA